MAEEGRMKDEGRMLCPMTASMKSVHGRGYKCCEFWYSNQVSQRWTYEVGNKVHSKHVSFNLNEMAAHLQSEFYFIEIIIWHRKMVWEPLLTYLIKWMRNSCFNDIKCDENWIRWLHANNHDALQLPLWNIKVFLKPYILTFCCNAIWNAINLEWWGMKP